MVAGAGGRGWLLLDNHLVRNAWRQIWPTKVLPFQWQLAAINMLFGKRKYRDPASLRDALGLDREVLAETLRQTARVADGLEADPFGKPLEDVHRLEFPLHVIDVCNLMNPG